MACKPISRSSIDATQLDSPSVKKAGIVLNLANANVTVEQAKILATLTIECGESAYEVIEQVRRTTAETEAFTDAIATYFLKLRDLAGSAGWRVEQGVIGALNELFRRRKSKLDNPRVYEETHLPPGL